MKCALVILLCVAAVKASYSSVSSSIPSATSSGSYSTAAAFSTSAYAPFSAYISSSTVSTTYVPASLAAPVVSSALAASASHDLAVVAASYPSISADLEYVALLVDEYPSAECAEKTLEQDVRSHYSSVEYIEEAISSPSVVSRPSYVSKLEQEFPSVVTAYKAVLTLEESHPQLAYVQYELPSIELRVSTALTDESLEEAYSNPTLVTDEDVVYTIVTKSPSVLSDVDTVIALESLYPSLVTAESIIAYYEEVEPSIIASISDAVFSPASAHSPLPAEYPTLASAEKTAISLEETLPATVVEYVEEAIDSPSSVPPMDESYVKELVERYTSLASADREIENYMAVCPTVVDEVETIESNPVELHAPEMLSYPELAHAEMIVDSYKTVVPASVIVSVANLEVSPNKIKASSFAYAKHQASAYVSLADAEKVIASYMKRVPAAVHKVSEEMSNSLVIHEQHTCEEHRSLLSALREVNYVAKSYKELEEAQESIDCAESAKGAAHLISDYQHMSYAKHSARQSIHHSCMVSRHSFQNQVVRHG